MESKLNDLTDLYYDLQTCAQLVGLDYITDEIDGITRRKQGKGFNYSTASGSISAKLRQRIEALVIPPAWQNVWICPSEQGHVLATGIDDKGRKQYIYHPKWRTMRDLVKFYRLITFAHGLPKIRRFINKNLELNDFSEDKLIAVMLWILDNAYIRIGNDSYFNDNESVGLTTLTDKNVIVAGTVVTFAFKGKSGKEQQITFENPTIAKTLRELQGVRGTRLFRYQDADNKWQDIDAARLNSKLHDITSLQITAKDFRTWGGTLMAFLHLADEGTKSDKKPEKVVIQAVDQAAAVLGNTRTVARSSYVHPHLLDIYAGKNFKRYLKKAAAGKKLPLLDKNESCLLHFLELMFETEFELLKNAK